MDGKGRAIDNIFVERLWRSVKYENIYLYAYEDGLSLYQGLYRYFEFYNNERLHESLDYETPGSHYLKYNTQASETPCGQLAIFSQRLTAPAHGPKGEPQIKYRSTLKNTLN
jgi:putative transposase